MAWEHLSINKPHLVYIILGGFTSLFMLCSSFIKERLYIGEATVATICGIIFGPHAANLIDPATWGNVDQITLEFSRIVLVVQCFAVGVELPKYYMEKHWRSVTLLLLPVMTFGWLVTSLFIWWMVPTLNWLESLVVASCVTATDPVLASSVVGKGKFAKRVPKHLRDLLSAESGCNDGMAFPFVYLGLYIIHYGSHPNEVAFHWIVLTILYECIFGAIYGFTIGYIGRRGIRWAEKHDLIDRESFLVFYFVLALFCAGSGSMLGVDDLLVGFAAGVGFSNDGWFTQKTEESHVSNVIDLLINLAYFVYFGTIVPWEQFNSPELGTAAWRLVIIAIFVLFFRRIPIMLALKPVIPDIKSWREALFAGHFGPIGVGAIFIAILARAELETGSTTPLAVLPEEGMPHYHLIALIWPITTFLVVTSIIVHGSSIAVFTLGKHINTLTLTMSYTTAHEDGPGWMNRLPRISSQSKSMSKNVEDYDETPMQAFPPGTLAPGMPNAFLRRQKEEDADEERHGGGIMNRRRKKSHNRSYGGPISQSAISPMPRSSQATSPTLTPEKGSEEGERRSTEGEHPIGEIQHDNEMEEIMHRGENKSKDKHTSNAEANPNNIETFQEGDDIIFENEDGDVIDVEKKEDVPPNGPTAIGGLGKSERGKKLSDTDKSEADEPQKGPAKNGSEKQNKGYKAIGKKLGVWMHKDAETGERQQEPKRKRGPALAYQFGNTIIVEDEDGEVVKKYEMPRPDGAASSFATRPVINRLGTLMGGGSQFPTKNTSPNPTTTNAAGNPTSSDPATMTPVAGAPSKKSKTVEGINKWTGINALKTLKTPSMDDPADDKVVRFTMGGRRMTKEGFLKEMKSMTPKERAKIVEHSNAPAAIKEAARKDADPNVPGEGRLLEARNLAIGRSAEEATMHGEQLAAATGASGGESANPSPLELQMRRDIREESRESGQESEEDSPASSATLNEETKMLTPADLRRAQGATIPLRPAALRQDTEETPAERRRRVAALGHSAEPDELEQPRGRGGIRFAEEPRRHK